MWIVTTLLAPHTVSIHPNPQSRCETSKIDAPHSDHQKSFNLPSLNMCPGASSEIAKTILSKSCRRSTSVSGWHALGHSMLLASGCLI